VDTGPAAALPLALAAAVSPGLLAIVLLILSSENRPKARAWSYLVGVVTVILVVTLVGIVTLRAVVEAFGTSPTGWSVAVKVVVAILLLGLGLRYLRRPDSLPAGQRPWLEDRLRAAGPPVFYVLGVATMSTNWSTLMLYLSALEVVRSSATSTAITLSASFVVLLITISPLLLPVLAVTVVGHRSDRLLAFLAGFANRHSHQIIAGIYFVLAVLVVASALTDLARHHSVSAAPIAKTATIAAIIAPRVRE
jgi:CBS domain-containing protein